MATVIPAIIGAIAAINAAKENEERRKRAEKDFEQEHYFTQLDDDEDIDY